MSAVKVQRKKMIFYGLVVYIVIAFYLMAEVNEFLAKMSDPRFGMPLSKRYNNTNFHAKQLSNALERNSTLGILIFNPPIWLSAERVYKTMVKTCKFKNCMLTSNISNVHSHSAIIFYTTEPLPWKPPILPSNRNPNQVWIFAWKEAAVRHRQNTQWTTYENEHWRDTVNWTMAYTYDSDVFYGYGTIRNRIPPIKNYSAIFQRKTKMAAWIVSNCHTLSQREKYVELMQQHGINVDIFGKCAGKKLDSNNTAIRNEINLNYKFYLSFENSLCKDYITEKFFKYFQYDVLLVVRGGGNYSSLLPDDSYINTADFASVKDLAKYLLAVGSSEKRYIKYLMNKDMFEYVKHAQYKSYCHICEKLNHLEDNRRTYTDLVKRVHDGTCTSPTDLK